MCCRRAVYATLSHVVLNIGCTNQLIAFASLDLLRAEAWGYWGGGVVTGGSKCAGATEAGNTDWPA